MRHSSKLVVCKPDFITTPSAAQGIQTLGKGKNSAFALMEGRHITAGFFSLKSASDCDTLKQSKVTQKAKERDRQWLSLHRRKCSKKHMRAGMQSAGST
jgi:hypothetical protein